MAFDTVIDQIKAVRGETEVVIVKLGDVTGLSNGRAQVRIYGDSDASNKLYHYIAGYIPEVGDKVALLPQGKTYIIIGKVTDQKPEEIYARKEWVEENYLPDDYKNVLEQGDGETLTFTNNELVPKTNNKHSLGSSSYYFKNLFLKALIGAAYQYESNSANNIAWESATALIPNNTDTVDLGKAAKEFNKIYAKELYQNGSVITPDRLTVKNGGNDYSLTLIIKNAGLSNQYFLVRPSVNGKFVLGDTSYTFNSVYFSTWGYGSDSIYWDSSKNITPNATDSISLGTATKQYNKVYAKEIYVNGVALNPDGDIDTLKSVSGSYTRTLKLTATSAGANLLPSVNNAFELGSSTYKFKLIYVTTIYGDLDGALKDGNQDIKFDSSHNLNPSATNYFSLGTSNKQYKNIYGQNIYVNGSAVSSDRNLKEEIEPLEDKHIEFFKNLKPVSYKFKDGTSGRRHTGFIAQEVEEAIEEAGMTDKDMAAVVKDESQYYLRYEEIIAVQTKVIQDLMARVEKLEAKVNRLEAERSRT